VKTALERMRELEAEFAARMENWGGPGMEFENGVRGAYFWARFEVCRHIAELEQEARDADKH